MNRGEPARDRAGPPPCAPLCYGPSVRPLALLPVPLLLGCLVQNPGFDTPQHTSSDSSTSAALTSSAASTADPVTTDLSGTTTDLSGTGTGTGTTTGEPATTGCELLPLFPDADDDGFGAGASMQVCAGTQGFAAQDGDCDDADDAVNPGIIEVCNQLDDDCDGLTDEFSAANIDCANCGLAAFGAHSYWFCRKLEGWDDARAHCQGFGPVDLTIVDELAENDFLFAGNAIPDAPMWIGGRDSDPDMTAYYTWYDGSPLTFNNFALADLDNGCIAMPNGDAGKWRDRDCGFDYSFACESKG